MDLWQEEIQQLINKKAIEDLTILKSQKKIPMPSKNDIKLLYTHVKAEGDKAQAILEEKFDFDAWKSLTECTLILIQIFNRKRAGDIEQLTMDQIANQDAVGKNISREMFDELSKPAQQIAKKFVRVSNRGKLGRPVSMLVHSYILPYIDLIKKYRLQAGVKKTNDYLFGRPTRNPLQIPYFRACPLMRKFSASCGAKVPTALRGTPLRKHVATYTAMIGIEDTDVERLASFMGHHKDIHKNYYQMPVPLAEMTKVANLLEVAIGVDNEENESESSSDEESDDDDKNDENT
ncbi:GSCOCG00011358001-RA-CDS, partial [Cotesia congregata]